MTESLSFDALKAGIQHALQRFEENGFGPALRAAFREELGFDAPGHAPPGVVLVGRGSRIWLEIADPERSETINREILSGFQEIQENDGSIDSLIGAGFELLIASGEVVSAMIVKRPVAMIWLSLGLMVEADRLLAKTDIDDRILNYNASAQEGPSAFRRISLERNVALQAIIDEISAEQDKPPHGRSPMDRLVDPKDPLHWRLVRSIVGNLSFILDSEEMRTECIATRLHPWAARALFVLNVLTFSDDFLANCVDNDETSQVKIRALFRRPGT